MRSSPPIIADHAPEARSHPVRSFRDPAGSVFQDGGRILRQVNAEAIAPLEEFLRTPSAREAMERGALVHSTRLSEGHFEHERIPFASFPYEWSPEMLHDAARLTIELARQALADGFGLKDATPYNVLFRGSDPVFVDLLSFERRDPLDSTWLAYGQFSRTFLLPLLANRCFGMPLASIFTGLRDGLEPETLYRWAGPLRRFTPSFLRLVSIPKWLSGGENSATYRTGKAGSAEQARFVLDGVLKSCERHLTALKPSSRDSYWSGYLDHKSIYSAAQLAQKEKFVREAIAFAEPRRVLDIGANEGHFSFLAARQGASVVAIDSDPAVVGAVWRAASKEKLDVLPLVVDLTRPTPATGWRNRETASFLERARGDFDLVMMLAVLHHMTVTERIPLDEIFDLTAEISREYALIEFVAPQDPMFQRIVRGRDRLYSNLTRAAFETAASKRFELLRSTQIEGLDRWLYLYRRRSATT